jgi:hypothetical protein
MTDKSAKKYRARSLAMSEWYIIERSTHYGLIGACADAVIETKEWWEENLAPGWEAFFDLEEVEETEREEQTT